MIQSPLNYTGGKYRLLPQILPLFPQRIDVFVDLFCGGCNVGINVVSNRVIYNDIDRRLFYIYQTFQILGKEAITDLIYDIINKYDLSLVSKYGYEYYHCESGKGVGNYNRDKYLKMRDEFNHHINENNYYYYVLLYVIIVYAFNNQIRFNSRGEFNLPVGKRDFNKKKEEKLQRFIDRIKQQDCRFTCVDFREFDITDLTNDDFVYVDPPYLITCATYNEQGGWNEKDEKDLLKFLDRLHCNNIKFALSNVLRSKGKENRILIDWVNNNEEKYKTIFLDYNYSKFKLSNKRQNFK